MSKHSYRAPQQRLRQVLYGQQVLGLLLALLCGTSLAADAPPLFSLNYDARYGSLRAESVRSLTQAERQGLYHMQAQSKVVVLGASVSTITENATFNWQDGLPQSLQYSYKQSGLGARERSVVFDHEARMAQWQVKNKRGEIPLEGMVFDELTAFLVLRQRLELGEQDIRFEVLDRDHVETHHYRVLSEEPLRTALGDFAVTHVARIREEGNKRRTEFWLARDHDYVLLKLEQTEPDGSTINLNIKGGSVNGTPLQARR